MDFISILNTGVSGFAFLMLFIGYSLTASVQKKILDVNLQDTEVSKLEIWGRYADKQLENTRYFMLFSVFILIAGLVVLQLQYRAEAKVKLSINPTEYMPLIMAQGDTVEVDNNGGGDAMIKDGDIIMISNRDYDKKLSELKEDLEKSESKIESLRVDQDRFSGDSGLGSMFKGGE